MPRRIEQAVGRAALDAALTAAGAPADEAPRAGNVPAAAGRRVTGLAVRWTLQVLAEQVPGNSVEVRVPPFGVTQCIAGPRHTRGTPPAIVETDGATWLALATGSETWAAAVARGAVRASGTRADLADVLPLHLP